MKKHVIIIIGVVLNLLVGCNVREKHENEDAYNPYDTSELESYKDSDTIYEIDSAIKTIRLSELK